MSIKHALQPPPPESIPDESRVAVPTPIPTANDDESQPDQQTGEPVAPSTESVGGDVDITPQATVGEENDSRKMPTSEMELADHRRYPDRVRNPPNRLNL